MYGCPLIEGTIKDDASVNHDAYVGQQVVVQGNASIWDDATLEDRAIVGGNAEVCESASLRGDAVIDGNAVIGGHMVIGGNAHIGGNALLRGVGFIGGNADINSNDDIVIVQGLTPCPLAVYKSSTWGIEVATEGTSQALQTFLHFGDFPQSVREVVRAIAKKWQE
jgi:NDP-sugar pyrophosphorylase family protein